MIPNADHPVRRGYCSSEKAAEYARRSPARGRAEKRLLSRLLARIRPEGEAPGLRVLDVPAGAGRMARFLEEQGFDAFETDISKEMLFRGQEDGSKTGVAVVGDLQGRLPFKDAAFDLVLCWRFLHHLPGATEVADVLSEAARVTRCWVIASFFHPCSLHNLQRKAGRALGGAAASRHAIWPAEIRRAAGMAGLEMKWTAAQLPFLKDLWAALFIKVDG
jgi:SAM-dependent methyltransferase